MVRLRTICTWPVLWFGLNALLAQNAQALSPIHDQAFLDRVSELATRYGIAPTLLMHVFSFETAGTLSPSVRNPRSGAVGLIQFTESTARELGTSTDQLATMSALEQLAFVERYLERTPLKKVPAPTLADLYIAVLAPKYVLATGDVTVFDRTGTPLAYTQNIEFDVNSDGRITRAEVDGVITGSISPHDTTDIDVSEGFVDVSVNGSIRSRTAYLYRDPDGKSYMSQEDFMALGFSTAIDPVMINGSPLVPLPTGDGITLDVDFDNSKAALSVPAEWYSSTMIDLDNRHSLDVIEPTTGTLVNYAIEVGGDIQNRYSALGLLSASHYTSYGLFEGTVGLEWRHDDELPRILKGDTFFLHENPEDLTFLRIGDSLSPGGPGTRSTRMAGISYGSNFSLDPSYNPYLSYAYSGEALLPTKIDFVRDGRPVSSGLELPPGPFELSNLPVVDGNGDLMIRLTDETGTVKEVTVPYFRSSRLFKQGVHDFNYAIGIHRNDAHDYRVDEPFAATSHRLGLTDRLTVSGSALIDLNGAKAGAGLAYPILASVIMESFGAVSYDENGLGFSVGSRLTPFGSARAIDWGISAEFSSETFLHSDDLNNYTPRSGMNVFVGKTLEDLGRFSLFASYRDYWEGDSDLLGGVSWSRRLFDGLSANIEVGYDTHNISAMIGLNYTLPDHNSFVSTQAGTENGSSYVGAQYVKQRPQGPGIGYQVGAYHEAEYATDSRDRIDGKLYARNGIGDYAGSISTDGHRLKGGARAAGSVSIVDSDIYLAPPVQGSVAIIDTGDVADVAVYKWNSEVGRTNSDGKMALTNLSNGNRNKITIMPEDVPMDYKVEKTEIQFVPQQRGFYRLNYGISKQRSAVVILKLPNGQHVPAGAKVSVVDTGEEAWVVSDGEVFFEHLPLRSRLVADLGFKKCEVNVDYPDSDDPQPTLGPLECISADENAGTSVSGSAHSIY